MITPEEAQDEVERSWYLRSQSEFSDCVCGWCRFAQAVGGASARENACIPFCPVPAVFGVRCCSLPEIEKWLSVYGQLTKDVALEVYELAVRMRSRLVEAAYNILEEHDG